jgi:hypothetical protein
MNIDDKTMIPSPPEAHGEASRAGSYEAERHVEAAIRKAKGEL